MKYRFSAASVISLFLVAAAWLFLAGASEPQSEETKVIPGPAPLGPPRETKVAKVIPNQKKKLTAAELMRKKMAEPPEMPWAENPMTLGEALQELEKKYGFPKIIIDEAAFKVENPDAPKASDTPINFPILQGIPRTKLLRMFIDQIPTANAAYLVRSGFIEITTSEYSTPINQYIDGKFQDLPLVEVLAELADRTGITIIVDGRAGDKAKTPSSATFQPETNLVTAVRLLADMADLKLIVIGRTLYVTLRTNNADFPPGNVPGFKHQRMESA